MKFDNIICIDFTKFKSVDELNIFIKENDLDNIHYNDDKSKAINYDVFFKRYNKIWICGKYIISHEKKNGEFTINSDLERFIKEESSDVIKKVESTKKEMDSEFISGLSVDFILDRISKIGIENITESERKFLDENG